MKALQAKGNPYSASELNVCVAQPATNPGSLVNHRITSRIKRANTLNSPYVMGPRSRCCSLITLYAAISFSVFTALQPHVFLKLVKGGREETDNGTQTVVLDKLRVVFFYNTYLNPMKRNCSHSQAKASIRIMFGNAKPNQDAKLMTSPFCGNSLREKEETSLSMIIE